MAIEFDAFGELEAENKRLREYLAKLVDYANEIACGSHKRYCRECGEYFPKHGHDCIVPLVEAALNRVG